MLVSPKRILGKNFLLYFTGIDTSTTYTKVVVFFDFGEKGDDTTYYYDEITLN